MIRPSTLSRLALLVFLGLTAAGCAAIGGIFKAGVGVGAVAVLIVVVLIVVVIGKIKG